MNNGFAKLFGMQQIILLGTSNNRRGLGIQSDSKNRYSPTRDNLKFFFITITDISLTSACLSRQSKMARFLVVLITA
jgi:hypothetical protein